MRLLETPADRCRYRRSMPRWGHRVTGHRRLEPVMGSLQNTIDVEIEREIDEFILA